MPLEKSAEHKRIEGLVNQFPEGTRKGDDARARLRDLERQFKKDNQYHEGKGQFIQAEKTKPGLKAKARRALRR